MRDIKSPDNLSYRFFRDVEDQSVNPGGLYCQAIENANGVPFQLVFGRRTGEGYYLNVGEGIRKLLGISPEEFTEKRYFEIIDKIVPLSADISPELSVVREKFINGELKSYRAEVLIRMPGGEKKWIEDTSLPWIDEESGKVIGAYGILFDINDHKKTLGYLEKSKEQAEESDRLKDAFLHNVSHEIRTPLNAIIGFSTLLCDIESDPARRQEFVDIIFQSSDHLLELINSIVEISKIESETVRIRREVINLHSTLMRVYDRFRPKAVEKNITLRCVEPPGDSVVKIVTDGLKLLQVLTNLVENAVKFTEKGEVEFGYSINDKTIDFYVSDTGIGILPVHLPMIFSRFFQGESSPTRRFEGIGLGLSISKAYIELLGGKIWFATQSGKGSDFYFTLPFERVGE